MKDTVLVVPSIRKNCFDDFYKRWNDVGLFERVDLILMEDNPTKTFEVSGGVVHYSWKDIDDDLLNDAWIVPRRSDTVRSYAYLKAWQKNYEYIMTLDDDCYPEEGFEQLDLMHKKCLNNRTKWFNTLNSGKPRGIPFYNLGKRNVVLNHGLWTNVLDYDAPTQLVNSFTENFSFDNRVVPHDAYFPLCGMNVMWRSEITVLMYHMLMGKMKAGTGRVSDDNGLVKLSFDRFGDIFCGIVLKKITDVKRLSVSSGTPYVRHERASNPFTNLKKEAYGIEVNEKFWEHVDQADLSFDDSLDRCYSKMGSHIEKWNEFPEHRDYFSRLGKAMMLWADLFKK